MSIVEVTNVGMCALLPANGLHGVCGCLLGGHTHTHTVLGSGGLPVSAECHNRRDWGGCGWGEVERGIGGYEN